MNKAFTKESDLDASTDPVVEPLDPLPAGVPNYITPAGAVAVRGDLRRLIDKVKPELESQAGIGARDVAGARDAEIRIKARRRLAEVTARIRLLEEHVGRFEIVDPSAQSAERARFGARVTVIDEDGGERTYLICGVDEAEPESGSVSWISPIAKALLGGAVGDEITLRLPRGEQVWEIVDIEY